MSGSVNKVILVGHIGKDPETRFSGEGGKIINFFLATNESWKDKNTGEKKERTDWHRIVILNERLVEVVEKYLQKGSKVYIEGQLQHRKWKDQSDVEHYTTEVVVPKFKGEIVLLDTKSDGQYNKSSSNVPSNFYNNDRPF